MLRKAITLKVSAMPLGGFLLNFAPLNQQPLSADQPFMTKKSKQRTDRNIQANRQYADERTELLEVISEMVDQTIEAKLREYMYIKQ